MDRDGSDRQRRRLILGDLNSYAREESIGAILAGADDVAGTGDDYTNLIARHVGVYAYSYVFDGQSGYLDHALSFATLTPQVTGATEWHINADESDLLDYDTSFKPAAQEAIYEADAYRSSDHDAVLVGLDPVRYSFTGFLHPLSDATFPLFNEANAGQQCAGEVPAERIPGHGRVCQWSPLRARGRMRYRTTSPAAGCSSSKPYLHRKHGPIPLSVEDRQSVGRNVPATGCDSPRRLDPHCELLVQITRLGARPEIGTAPARNQSFEVPLAEIFAELDQYN